MTSIRVCLAGATGKVGQALVRAILHAADLELVAAVSRTYAGQNLGQLLNEPQCDLSISGSVDQALVVNPNVFVDYTKADSVKLHVLKALEQGVHTVIGTSGLTEPDYAEIHALALKQQVGAFAAGNFAITAVLMQHFATIAAKYLPQWEIIDYGSASKIDAPSGTSRELAYRLSQVRQPVLGQPIAQTVGSPESRGATIEGSQVHSLRLPGYLSSAEVVFGLPGERLSIRHDATDGAAPYVTGTLLAIRRVQSMIGLSRGLDALMDL